MKEMWGEKPNGSDEMGKMINEMHTKRIERVIKTAGGKIVTGGKVNLDLKYVEPTVILKPDLDAEVMKEEIFGPVLPVYDFDKLDYVIDFINDREKPLALYYFGKEKSYRCKRMWTETSSGGFATNECIMHLLSHHTGFGGVGQSGHGRYGGYEGYKNFTNRKAVTNKRPAPPLTMRLATPPFDEGKKKKLRCALPCITQVTQQKFQKALYASLLFFLLYKLRYYVWLLLQY
jgi:aldehyde dehydrogenase (NAD+)